MGVKMEKNVNEIKNSLPKKTLLVLYSYHHHNTEKIAKVFSEVLDAEIKIPQQVNPEELQEYDLVGFWLRDIQCKTRRISA